MGDIEGSKEDELSHSVPQTIPRQLPLKLDYNSAQSASYVSQRSSSIETYESSSPTNSSEGQVLQPQVQDDLDKNASSAVSEESTIENDSAAASKDDTSAESHPWLCGDESLPSSMLHPEHQSTPLKDDKYMSTVNEEEEGSESVSVSAEPTKQKENEKEVFQPGELRTPITGFETMEARSRFTVYKIQVGINKTAADPESEPCSWFVFRRYSDFVHLNERLKFLFPGFRLSLPPKRWFRDNFDKNFLDDRVIGLQAFLDNITGHKDICNSHAVRGFFCTDDPPGPHDSLEESRAFCETLEESMYSLRLQLQEKDSELSLMKDELDLYKSQVELLTKQLRVMNSSVSKRNDSISSDIKRRSLTECDLHALPPSVTAQTQSENPVQVQNSEQVGENEEPVRQNGQADCAFTE